MNFFPDFELPRTPEEIAKGFSSQEEGDKHYELLRRIDGGELVPKEEMPRRFFHSANDQVEMKLPIVFNTPFLLLKDKAIRIFKEFDLGNAYFHPVELFHFDRTTPVKGQNVSMICIGNVKDTVRVDQSQRIKLRRPNNPNVYKISVFVEDDEVVTKASALNDPDIWIDPRIHNAWFFSDRLAQALIKAGLKETLRMVRTKTI
ncbi:MAG: hypothetical protein CR993_02805 [Rhodobacterales bacterium]|nr:MAG: hypothetical protein CR993_02805 [Rhodobacterales bacterium]